LFDGVKGNLQVISEGCQEDDNNFSEEGGFLIRAGNRRIERVGNDLVGPASGYGVFKQWRDGAKREKGEMV